MKHSLKITLFLIALFLITQLIGLVTVNKHIQVSVDEETGLQVIAHPPTFAGESYEPENKSYSFIYIALGVLIGTILLFILIKFHFGNLWRYWFFFAVFLTLAVAFGVYTNYWIAGILAFLLAVWKIYKPNPLVHNLTEVFVYTGLAVLFLPLLNLTAMFILLIIISIYDMIAVWKSKHMVKLAQFQTESQLFAGLFIPYAEDRAGKATVSLKAQTVTPKKELKAKGSKTITLSTSGKSAILGGGDIAFPLLFSSTVMEYLITEVGFAKPLALGLTGITTITVAIALTILLIKAEKEKFYPAMPFLTAGCFVGLGIIWLGWLL